MSKVEDMLKEMKFVAKWGGVLTESELVDFREAVETINENQKGGVNLSSLDNTPSNAITGRASLTLTHSLYVINYGADLNEGRGPDLQDSYLIAVHKENEKTSIDNFIKEKRLNEFGYVMGIQRPDCRRTTRVVRKYDWVDFLDARIRAKRSGLLDLVVIDEFGKYSIEDPFERSSHLSKDHQELFNMFFN